MVVTLSGKYVLKILKLVTKIMILAMILLYILPQLVSLLWYIHYPEPKLREDNLLEKPLRVTAVLLEAV